MSLSGSLRPTHALSPCFSLSRAGALFLHVYCLCLCLYLCCFRDRVRVRVRVCVRVVQGMDPCSVRYFANGEYMALSGSDNKAYLYTKDGVKLQPICERETWIWCYFFFEPTLNPRP